MRKVLALTSIRSEYDLMSRVFHELQKDPEVDLRLLVSGAHLSPQFGMTVEDVCRDGFTILARVETLLASDSPSARLKTAASLLFASIDIVRGFAPDVIVFAGDREDVLVGGMLGAFLGIPTVHFFGGDHAADGHVDNPVRHATSKLASAHFVSIESHRQRLLHLGEPAHRIFLIGSVALDKFVQEPSIEREEVLCAMHAKPAAETMPLAVLIFHPIEEERSAASEYVRNAIEALTAAGYHVCIGSPNTDPGNASLLRAYQAFDADPCVTFYRNLPRSHFVNLLRHATLITGNSSAGLLESATLRLPAINIGLRQRGRLAAPNVVFCDGDRASIAAAIRRTQEPAFRDGLATLSNPYGNGHSAEQAALLLRTLDLAALARKPEDPLDAL
jgi:UDP-hydrolysing UDP-N-acetyl-D-glucosamine 2-epimerase